MRGPKSDPPMPMLTMWLKRRPVWPRLRPARTASAKAYMRRRAPAAGPRTARPATPKGAGAGARGARVQHGATFRGVDFIAAKHGLEAVGGAGLCKKLLQKPQGLFRNPVLGIVEEEEVVQADGLCRNAGGIREEVAQVVVE